MSWLFACSSEASKLKKLKKVLVCGIGECAQFARKKLTECGYDIPAYIVEDSSGEYRTELDGVPVVKMSQVVDLYPPKSFAMFLFTVQQTKGHQVTRLRIYRNAKNLGYHFVSYISPRATVLCKSSALGENLVVLDGAIIGPGCKIGSNVVIWEHVTVDEGVTIGNDAYISTSCAIGHAATIGSNVHFGQNVGVEDSAVVADDCVVAPGDTVRRNIDQVSRRWSQLTLLKRRSSAPVPRPSLLAQSAVAGDKGPRQSTSSTVLLKRRGSMTPGDLKIGPETRF